VLQEQQQQLQVVRQLLVGQLGFSLLEGLDGGVCIVGGVGLRCACVVRQVLVQFV
jgi:hypothetical protein